MQPVMINNTQRVSPAPRRPPARVLLVPIMGMARAHIFRPKAARAIDLQVGYEKKGHPLAEEKHDDSDHGHDDHGVFPGQMGSQFPQFRSSGPQRLSDEGHSRHTEA